MSVDQGTPTFARLRAIWADPLWLNTTADLLDTAPREAFLVLDAETLRNTYAGVLEALTNPSLGNKIVICELLLDIFDKNRKGMYHLRMPNPSPDDWMEAGVDKGLSGDLRTILSNPKQYNLHIQHVCEYSEEVLRNESVDEKSEDETKLCIACAAYFNRSQVLQHHGMKTTILVTSSRPMQLLAAKYGIEYLTADDLLGGHTGNK